MQFLFQQSKAPLSAGSTIPIQVEGQQEIKIEPATPSAPGTPASPASPQAVPVCPAPQQQSSLSSTQTDARVSGSVGTFAKEETSQTKQTSSLVSQQPGRSLTPGGMLLPITTRGLFFGDSFFKNTWQDFQEAVSDVVSRWGNFSADDDAMTRYMTLRAGDVKDENQAVKSTEDEANYKVSQVLRGLKL